MDILLRESSQGTSEYVELVHDLFLTFIGSDSTQMSYEEAYIKIISVDKNIHPRHHVKLAE